MEDTQSPAIIHEIVSITELRERGLNEKAENLHPQIERLLREILSDRVKRYFPKNPNQPWHFVKIHYDSAVEKYHIQLAPGFALKKG